MDKEPVELNDSVVEVDGAEVETNMFQFWADTFRYSDVLKYQDGPTKTLFTSTDQSVTYELVMEYVTIPQVVLESLETGDRFPITIENEYFDLGVDNARAVQRDGKRVTIVAEIPWESIGNATSISV